MLNQTRIREVLKNFIFFPDTSNNESKFICRYPQFFATRMLRESVLKAHSANSRKGGTYFGATGCGKSYTMLFLTRLLMKDLELGSPTIILITDRTDLDDQLSVQFTNAKTYLGDQNIISVDSRVELREYLKGRKSGGIFLTTIQKFTEDLKLLTERTNVICISDEAHRSQVNLEQKIITTENGLKKTYDWMHREINKHGSNLSRFTKS